MISKAVAVLTKKNAVVKYSLLKASKQIFTSKYQMYLSTEKQLQKEIETARDLVSSRYSGVERTWRFH